MEIGIGIGIGIGGAFCYLFPIVMAVLVIRVAYVLYWTGRPLGRSGTKSLRTLIVLGSGKSTSAAEMVIIYSKLFGRPGGHTAEMLSVVNVLQKERFARRFYVAALTDNMSLQKAQVLEESLVQHEETSGRKRTKPAQFMQIYRSREVGQSYITSSGTTLIATMHAMWLIVKIRPQVILCNGPGTCIPLCVCAFVFKVLGLRWSSIFYIESIARVRKLSLSGLLLYKLRLADQFFVQWPQLQQMYPRAHYAGRLM